MTPVMQDRLHSADGLGAGNCFPACLASLLELPLWMVPPFDEMHGRGAEVVWDRVEQWLARMFKLELVLKGQHTQAELPEFYIASGKSSRGFMHAVIYSNGQLVHDPHPSGQGIAAVKYCQYLERVNG